MEDNNFSELLEIAKSERGVIRFLISLVYDKKELLSWKAIEALGLISGETARRDPAVIRNLVGRLLWTIREESGGIGWSAPEILGEIVRNSPDEFSDIAPIIASFHDEDMLRPGVMRALVRISEARPDLINLSLIDLEQYLKHADDLVRAYASMLTGRLGLKEYLPVIETLLNDNDVVKIYETRDFKEYTIGQIAEQTVIMLRGKEN